MNLLEVFWFFEEFYGSASSVRQERDQGKSPLIDTGIDRCGRAISGNGGRQLFNRETRETHEMVIPSLLSAF